MNDENIDTNDPVVETSRPPQKQLPLPGMAGIALYMLAISGVIAFGVVLLALYFFKLEEYVQLHPTMWAPRLKIWLRVFNIGLPAGGEFALMFGYMAIIFWSVLIAASLVGVAISIAHNGQIYQGPPGP